MISIDTLYNNLLTAQFGGVPFGVVDTSQEVGRRVFRFLFPGIDDAGFQDLGADDGPIAIRGILAGDNYIALMRQLKSVFRSAGPYTLVHPWLGSFPVVLMPQQRPKFTLAANELGICRFEVTCLPYNPQAQPGLDTLAALSVKVSELQADAQNWLAGLLSPAVQVVTAFGYAQNYLTGIYSSFTAAISTTASSGAISAAAAPALAAIASPTSAPSPSWAATTAAQMAAVPAAVADACTPLVPSAVAPGGSATAPAAADPTDTVTTLLASVAGVTGAARATPPGPALAAAMQALIVAAAVLASANIAYTSQQQAAAQAQVLYTAIDAAIFAAGTVAVGDPVNAAAVWRDLTGLKGALAADLNALIGRLPAVVIINIPTTMPAWLIAQYVSGDTPSEVYATYQDIIARNNVYNPALVPPGPLEVLNQ